MSSDIREHLMEHGRFVWLREIFFVIGLHFVSRMPQEYPILFYSFFAAVIATAILNMWLCQMLEEWTFGNLKVWDWSFSASSAIQYFLSSVFLIAVFLVDGVISWSGLLAVVMWLGAIESIAQLFYKNEKYLFPFLALMTVPGLASLMIHVEFDLKKVVVFFLVAGLSCISTAFRALKLRQSHKKFEALEMKIQEERSLIQKLFDMIPAKISWIDSQSKYKMVNQGLVQHLKVSSKSLLGSDFGFTQNPQFKELNQKIKAFIQSQQIESSFEYPVKMGEELRRHHVILKKINSSEGPEIILMTLDIEDFRKAQEKIKAG